MALIWADSFDHYGTGATGRENMLAGAWVQVAEGNGTFQPSDLQARTGSFSLRHNGLTQGLVFARRTNSPRQTLGLGVGLYLLSLPSQNNRMGMQFRNPANEPVVSVYIQTDGSLLVRAGNSASGPIIGLSDPIITAQAFNHIEIKLTADPIVGYVEIRVNDVPELIIVDANTGPDLITSVCIGPRVGEGSGSWTPPSSFWDDVFLWDDTGDYNNDFMGPQRVETYFPIADTEEDDWAVIGAAEGWEAINDVPPDGDLSYVLATDVGMRSAFSLPDLPPETAAVAGIYIPAYGKITDAGIGFMEVSMLKNSNAAVGPRIPLTTAYTYRGSVFETNPETNEPWDKDTFSGALVRVEKVD